MRRIHRSIGFLIILILLFIVCSTSIFYNFFYEEYNIKKFVTEWFTDDKKIQTSYQNAILTGTLRDNNTILYGNEKGKLFH